MNFASSAESVGGKNVDRSAFPGFSADFDVHGRLRFLILESRPGNDALRHMNSGLPSRLHHRFALNLLGEAMVKAGGETLLSSRSRAWHPDLHPQILRKSLKKSHDRRPATRGRQ